MHNEDSHKWYQKICPFKGRSKAAQETAINQANKCVRLVVRPLRIFQFLTVLLMFALIIYMITVTDYKLSSLMCIALIVFSGVYVFVLAIDVISQFSGGELHTVPMFLFSFLGTILFAIMGALLLFSYTTVWYTLTIACLSILTFILFLIDVSLILAFWKRTCNLCHQCCHSNQTELLFQKSYPVCTETVKCDLTTSVSGVKLPSDDENAYPDHVCRRIKHGRRRQYVDCPTSARTLAYVDVVDVQTEQRPTTDIQSQTQQQLKEAPVQTVSRCELCNRKIQLFSSPSATIQASTAQYPQCTPCPALVQLTRGSPCCPGCRCVTGIIQVLQQSQQQQTQRFDQLKQEKEASKEQKHWVQALDEAACDPPAGNQRQSNDSELTGGTITKLTLASYCVTPKRAHTSTQTAGNDAGRQIRKGSEPDESKKVRINAVRKEKEREKVDARRKNDVSPAEKEKTKMTSNAGKKSVAIKASAKKTPETNAAIESASVEEPEVPVKEPGRRSTTETLDSAMENARKSPTQSIDNIHETLGQIKPTKLISPPRQMADIIERLHEIEGTKMERATGDSRIVNEAQKDEDNVEESLNGVRKENTDPNNVYANEESRSNKLPSPQKKITDDKECENKCTGSEEAESALKPGMETQTEETASSSRTKKIYGFRKKNRVEPIAHANIDAQTSDCNETPVIFNKTEPEEMLADNQDTSDGRSGNVCPACKMLQVPNLNQYFSVHKDKRGRVFCEYCAPSNAIKVLHKNVDQKRWLKCSSCGNSLRTRTHHNSRNKPENCPNCGQTQMAPVSA